MLVMPGDSSFDYLDLNQFNKKLFVCYCHAGPCLFKQIGSAGTYFNVLIDYQSPAAI